MKTTTLATLASLMASAAAYPAYPFAVDRLWARTCTPGALVCNGTTKFALCTGADSTPEWMNVSEGTQCVCSGSECTITSTSNSGQSPGGGVSPGSSGSSGSAGPPPTLSSAPSAAASTAAGATFATSPPSGAAPAPTPMSSSGPPTPMPSSGPPPPASSGPGPSSAPAVPASSLASASAGPAPSSASAVPAPSAGPGTPGKGPSGYTMFLGDGSTAKGWPEESKWADFESMWSSNAAVMAKSCAAFSQPNNSDKETADVKAAVLSVAKEAGIDSRFVLAVVMQESNGCVRAPTTDYGVKNPGLMQSHNGANSCFNVNPCPADKIVGMIKDGTTGTSSGDGLKQILAKAGSGVTQYYKAARIYNSGSIASTGNLQDGIATHCYSSDVANRLVGWASGATGCKLS